MPGSSFRRYEFIGRAPLASRVLWILFVTNFAAMFFLPFAVRHIRSPGSANLPACPALESSGIQVHTSDIVCWYVTHSLNLHFVFLAAIGIVMLLFRKRLRYVHWDRKQSE